MCLALPGRIVSITDDAGAPVAEVDYGGPRRRAQLLYLPEARVGDWVLVQAGFAHRRLTEEEAQEARRLMEEALESGVGGPLAPQGRSAEGGAHV
jgi:hydrogenase expression/formation protein HypC